MKARGSTLPRPSSLGYTHCINQQNTDEPFIVLRFRDSRFWIGYIRDPGSCEGSGDSLCSNNICETNSTSDCCRCRAKFRWTDGQEMTYQAWSANEPQGTIGNECGWLTTFSKDSSAHRVGDGSCGSGSRFIWKKPSKLLYMLSFLKFLVSILKLNQDGRKQQKTLLKGPTR